MTIDALLARAAISTALLSCFVFHSLLRLSGRGIATGFEMTAAFFLTVGALMSFHADYRKFLKETQP